MPVCLLRLYTPTFPSIAAPLHERSIFDDGGRTSCCLKKDDRDGRARSECCARCVSVWGDIGASWRAECIHENAVENEERVREVLWRERSLMLLRLAVRVLRLLMLFCRRRVRWILGYKRRWGFGGWDYIVLATVGKAGCVHITRW